MYGAGGVANEPAYGTPTSGAFPSAAAAASAVPSAPRQAQPERSLRNNPIPAAADSALQDINFSRQIHIRSQTASPSPLAHVTYRSDVDLGRTFCDEGSDDSLSYGEIVQSTHYQGSSHPDAPPAGSSQIYETIEDEGSDEENMPIEVRRRRPSVAIAAASPSPPVDGEPL
jgi:[calcium/calmodulin-dependent protein kinase] kinase